MRNVSKVREAAIRFFGNSLDRLRYLLSAMGEPADEFAPLSVGDERAVMLAQELMPDVAPELTTEQSHKLLVRIVDMVMTDIGVRPNGKRRGSGGTETERAISKARNGVRLDAAERAKRLGETRGEGT